jgi:hypothetical protein
MLPELVVVVVVVAGDVEVELSWSAAVVMGEVSRDSDWVFFLLLEARVALLS